MAYQVLRHVKTGKEYIATTKPSSGASFITGLGYVETEQRLEAVEIGEKGIYDIYLHEIGAIFQPTGRIPTKEEHKQLFIALKK